MLNHVTGKDKCDDGQEDSDDHAPENLQREVPSRRDGDDD